MLNRDFMGNPVAEKLCFTKEIVKVTIMNIVKKIFGEVISYVSQFYLQFYIIFLLLVWECNNSRCSSSG